MKHRIFLTGVFPTEDILKDPIRREKLFAAFTYFISIIETVGDSSPFKKHPEQPKNLLVLEIRDYTEEHILECPEIEPDAITKARVQEILDLIREAAQSNQRIYLHCHMGYSRSPAIAVLLLLLRGIPPEEAFQTVVKDIAPDTVPNTRILRWADEIFGFDGRLTRLGKAHAAAVLEASRARKGNIF